MLLDLTAKTILKKKKKDPNKLVAQKPDQDFIPYVCHYSPNTILTKNGELMQTIRVTGFNNSAGISDIIPLREAVRDAISEHVKDTKFAFWFHTIRRRKNIVPKGEFDNEFCKKVNDDWVNDNNFDNQFVNELYITIIIEGLNTSITNFKSFIRSLSFIATTNLHRNFLEKEYKELYTVTKKILADLQDYGAKILGIKHFRDVLFSEPLRFFGKIINLSEKRYPLTANDISEELANHKIAFGDREIQVSGNDTKNFAAMLSLKEYFEISNEALDHILQLPFEFVITQSFDFSFDRKDLATYEYQNYILKVNGDEDFRQLSGIADFIESDTGNVTDYGKLQTTIAVINNSPKQLENDIKNLLSHFHDFGFVVIREDMFSEHCFWSQLPGNFRYLARQKIINSSKVAGFAALHNFPTGNIAGNLWGQAISVLKTVLDTPYFFNFHEEDLGHAIFVGPNNSGKTVFVNFLISQSQKFQPKIFYLDGNGSSKAFIKSLNGKYFNISPRDLREKINLNPILDANKDRKFLENFFTSLVIFSKSQVPEAELLKIPEIIAQILTSNISDFKLAVKAFDNSQTPEIYKKLQIWISEKLEFIFSNQESSNIDNENIIGFDLSKFINKKPIIVPLALNLLHKIEQQISGEHPAIIVIDEAWSLLDNNIMGPIIGEFLDRIQEKNSIVIFTQSNSNRIIESEFSSKIIDNCATQTFFPNSEAEEDFQEVFELSDEELEMVQVMNPKEGHFLLKHGDDSIIAKINLANHVENIRILSADEETNQQLDKILDNLNNENSEAKNWLPNFFKVLRDIENQKDEDEKEKLRQEKIAHLKVIDAQNSEE